MPKINRCANRFTMLCSYDRKLRVDHFIKNMGGGWRNEKEERNVIKLHSQK